MGGRVLIVDDDPGVAKVTAMVLRRCGFEADIAGDASLLRAHLASGVQYDAALLDVRFGHQDGASIAQEIKARGAETKLILWSADDLDDEAAVRNAGCVAFLRKPVRNQRLVTVLEAALAGSDIPSE